ncbi:unnamed protein product, partial [marine sediment metagenome]
EMTAILRTDDFTTCPACRGQGRVMAAKTITAQGLAVPIGMIPCPKCNGAKVVRVRKFPIRSQGWPN